ncbi:DUF1887 family protein [bacterium]|nr:DUF1887 family protein [bacterium]
MKVQICLVSEQVIPNIIPILMEKPDVVAFLYTKEFAEKLKLMEKFLVKKLPGLQFDKFLTDAYDVDKNDEVCQKISKKYSNYSFELNVTGGTKIMALTSFLVFENAKILYCNTNNHELLDLSDKKNKKIFNEFLTVEEYFTVNGFEITEETNEETIRDRKNLTMFLGENSNKLEDFLLNCRRAFQPQTDVKFPLEHKLIKVTQFLKDSFEIEFLFNEKWNKNTVEQKFLGGVWLEEYVYWELKDKGFSPKLGVKIQKGNLANELDVCFAEKNQLFWISCKSGVFSNKDVAEVEQFKTFFGGTFGKGFLVTSQNLTKALKSRAKELRITTIGSTEIKNIFQIITGK